LTVRLDLRPTKLPFRVFLPLLNATTFLESAMTSSSLRFPSPSRPCRELRFSSPLVTYHYVARTRFHKVSLKRGANSPLSPRCDFPLEGVGPAHVTLILLADSPNWRDWISPLLLFGSSSDHETMIASPSVSSLRQTNNPGRHPPEHDKRLLRLRRLPLPEYPRLAGLMRFPFSKTPPSFPLWKQAANQIAVMHVPCRKRGRSPFSPPKGLSFFSSWLRRSHPAARRRVLQ